MRNRNKALIITSIAMLVISAVAFLLGGWLAGWDFVAFFHSGTFVWICVMVGIYVLAVAAVLISDRIRRL